MYHNHRRDRACVSDDSVIQDVMTETRDLRVSVLHVARLHFVFLTLCLPPLVLMPPHPLPLPLVHM
jgi:hypothetical protein